MRLLRIDQVGDEAGSIEFHPQVTVVAGLRGAARARIIDGLQGLSQGRVGELTGEIEAQGVRLDLTTESLDLLELPSGADLIVRAHHLPGLGHDRGRSVVRRRELEVQRDGLIGRRAAAQEAVVAAEADRAEATEALAEARRAAAEREQGATDVADAAAVAAAVAEADRRVEDARAALASADQALADAEAAYAALEAAEDADEPISVLHERHAELRAATSRSADAVDSTQAELDHGAAPALEQAQEELSAAEAALAALGENADEDADADGDDERRDSFLHAAPAGDPQQVASMRAHRAALAEELDSLPTPDSEPVAVALAQAAAASPARADDAALGVALADQWDEISAHLTDLGVDASAPVPPRARPGSGNGDDEESDALVAARFRVTQARRQLADAKASVSNEPLDPEDVAALEAAHVEVLEAQERSESRFGGAKARRRLTEARESEQSILDRLRFATYAEFMMSSSRSLSVADEGMVEAARHNVDDAEKALARLAPETDDPGKGHDTDPSIDTQADAVADWNEGEVASVHERMADLRDDIEQLLGHDIVGDPTPELRSLGDVPDGGDPSVTLRQALTHVGMALEDADFQTDTLVALARVWLAEQAATDARRAELTRELAGVEAELGALGADPDDRATEPGPGDDEPSAEQRDARQRRDDAAEAVRVAEARLAAHDAVVASLVEREAEFADALAAEDDLAARISDLEADREGVASAQRAAHQAAAEAVQAAEIAHGLALAAEQEASAARAELPDLPEPESATEDEIEMVDPIPALEERLAASTELVGAASAESRTLDVQVASIDRQLVELAADEQDETERLPADHLTEEVLEEIEWYLLSRLADQRQVSVAGSLPLVLDDPFRGLTAAETTRLVSGIERMAGAVQLIVLSDDRALLDWAGGLEPARAGIVRVS